MTKIIARAADVNMGDTPAAECQQFRNWAAAEIKAEYPSADVEVLNEDGNTEIEAEGGRIDYDSEQAWIDAQEFVATLWDRCPWTGPHFE